MVTALTTAENQQGMPCLPANRKPWTKMCCSARWKNTVTKISAIGVHVFMETDPAVAVLFDDLIPSSPKATGNGTTNETQVA